MAAYVALIRAIGPVTHAAMGMAALAAACREAGLGDVASVGNTGNLVFRSDRSEAAVRRLVQDVVSGFGLGPANEVFIDTPRRMAEVVKARPFPEIIAERPTLVGVCTFHAAMDWRPLTEAHEGPERIVPVGRHLVIAYESEVSKLRIEKALGVTMTQRNWRVFAGLAEKAAALARG